MSMPKVRTRVSFIGGETLDVDSMLASINRAPDLVWDIGDRVGSSDLREKNRGWAIESEFLDTWDAGDVAEQFVEKNLKELQSAARSVPSSCLEHVEISIQISAEDRMPSICIGPKLLGAAHSIGACLDVDVVLS